MFKLYFYIKILSYDKTKYLNKNTLIILFLFFYFILKKNKNFKLIYLNKILNIKVLLMSPFHYKVAKKIIYTKYNIFNLVFIYNYSYSHTYIPINYIFKLKLPHNLAINKITVKFNICLK